MSKQDKIFHIKLLLIFLAIIALLIFFTTLKLREISERNILTHVNEVAQHDRKALLACIGLFLDELSGIEKRLAMQGSASLKALQGQLNLESASTDFTRLFMLARDGRIFGDGFRVLDNDDSARGGLPSILSRPENQGQRKLVLRLEDRPGLAELAGDSILFVLRLENFSVEGVQMAALVGCMAPGLLTPLVGDSGGNAQPLGASSVIDLRGNFILASPKSSAPGQEGNFFSVLAAASASSLGKREIMARMARHEEFSFYLEDGAGRHLVYFVPLAGQQGQLPDWYFILAVNDDLLKERQAAFSLMALSLLGLVVLALALLLFYGMFSRKRLRQAKDSVDAHSRFLSAMSHEIRTPLQAIIGLNHLIASHVGNPEKLAQVRDWLHKSRSLADYLLALLNDILDMSRLRSGKVDLAHARYSIADMSADVIFMQAALAERRGLRLTLEESIPNPFVLGDVTRVKQVLVNIIGNAIKFTAPGGSVTLSVRQERTGQASLRTFYRCRDTGAGMSSAMLQKLFDPFSQDARAQADAPLRGSGLGMSITRELVLAMGGSITVDSEEGAGSTFTVVIPSEIAEREAPRQGAPATARAPQSGASRLLPQGQRKGKILLVEDAEFNAEFLLELLADKGFSAVHAKNGEEALAIFKASAVDEFSVILMDMEMPVMDGCETTRAIRALKRPDAETVIIYACTANSFKEDMDKALLSGMDDFLTKPIDIKVFLQKMAAISLAAKGLEQGDASLAVSDGDKKATDKYGQD